MARADAYSETLKTPVSKYMEWSSNEKCFVYYDKEEKATKKVAVPLSFVHLQDFATIKGFHDASSSGIYSNEVKSTKTQELVVRSFKGGELARGIYQDIKLKVNGLGGKYNASIYVFLNGEICNIALRGAALAAWSQFLQDNRNSLLTTKVDITGFVEAKKGSVKYTIPAFALGKALATKEAADADAGYDTLMEYIKARDARNAAENTFTPVDVPARSVEEPQHAVEAIDDDPLPF